MKKIINLLNKFKKGVNAKKRHFSFDVNFIKELTVKILSVGNLKRVISILLLISMILTSGSFNTLANSGAFNNTNEQEENVEDIKTENENSENTPDEFYAENDNENLENEIDEDIDINSSGEANNSSGEANNSSGETNNSRGEANTRRGEALRARSSGEADTRRGEALRALSEGETNNSSEEEIEQNSENIEEPKNDETEKLTDNQEGKENTEQSTDNQEEEQTVDKTEEKETDATIEDETETNADEVEETITNDNIIKENTENKEEENISTKSEIDKVDKNLTNYIDLFIKDSKTGTVDKSWKIEKILMESTEDTESILFGEEALKKTIKNYEKYLNPVVDVVITDNYGYKKVAQVPIVWDKIYNEKEVIKKIKQNEEELLKTAEETVIDEKHVVRDIKGGNEIEEEISYTINKQKLIEEVEEVVKNGVEDLPNYTGEEEIKTTYIPEEVRDKVLQIIEDRVYKDLSDEGIVIEREKDDLFEDSHEEEIYDNKDLDSDELEYDDEDYIEEDYNDDEMLYEEENLSDVEEVNDNYNYNEEILDKEINEYIKKQNKLGSETDDLTNNNNEKNNDVYDNKEEIENLENENYNTNDEVEINSEEDKHTEHVDEETEEAVEEEPFDITEYINEENLEKVINNYKRKQREEYFGKSEEVDNANIIKKSKKLGTSEDATDSFLMPIAKKGVKQGANVHKHDTKNYQRISIYGATAAGMIIPFFYVDVNNYDITPLLFLQKLYGWGHLRICLNGNSIKNFKLSHTSSLKVTTQIEIVNCKSTGGNIIGKKDSAFFELDTSYVTLQIGSSVYTGPINFKRPTSDTKDPVFITLQRTILTTDSGYNLCFRNINIVGKVLLHPLNINTSWLNPQVKFIDCTFSYPRKSTGWIKEHIVDITCVDIVVFNNCKFNNFNYLYSDWHVVSLDRCDVVRFKGQNVFTDCSSGIEIGRAKRTNREYNNESLAGTQVVCEGDIKFNNCNQKVVAKDTGRNYKNMYPSGKGSPDNSASLLYFTTGFWNTRQTCESEDDNEKKGRISNRYIRRITIEKSIVVSNCHLIAPAIEMRTHMMESRLRLYGLEVKNSGKILIENNTYDFVDYPDCQTTAFGGTEKDYFNRVKVLATGMKLNGIIAIMHGDVIIRNNTVQSAKGLFDNAQAFGNYISGLNNKRATRFTSVENISNYVSSLYYNNYTNDGYYINIDKIGENGDNKFDKKKISPSVLYERNKDYKYQENMLGGMIKSYGFSVAPQYETRYNRTAVRPSMFAIGRWKNYKEHTKNPQYVFESPNFPKEYLEVAGINSYRDYFPGIIFSDTENPQRPKRVDDKSKIKKDFAQQEDFFCLSLFDDMKVLESRDDPNSSFISIGMAKYINGEHQFLYGKNRENTYITQKVPNPFDPKNTTNTFFSDLYANMEDYKSEEIIDFYPDEKFPFVTPKDQYNGELFSFIDIKETSETKKLFKGDSYQLGYSLIGGSKTGLYTIKYVLATPFGDDWKDKDGGNIKEYSQRRAIGDYLQLSNFLWTSTKGKQIGWSYTKDATTPNFELLKNLPSGIRNVKAGQTVTLYSVWEENGHKHRDCGCKNGDSDCEHVKNSDYIGSGKNIDKIFTKLTQESRNITESDNYVLTGNVEYNNETIDIGSNEVLICLNGFTMKGMRFIGSGKLKITNCREGGVIEGYGDTKLFGEELNCELISKVSVSFTVKTNIVGSRSIKTYGVSIEPIDERIVSNVVFDTESITGDVIIDRLTVIRGYTTNKAVAKVGKGKISGLTIRENTIKNVNTGEITELVKINGENIKERIDVLIEKNNIYSKYILNMEGNLEAERFNINVSNNKIYGIGTDQGSVRISGNIVYNDSEKEKIIDILDNTINGYSNESENNKIRTRHYSQLVVEENSKINFTNTINSEDIALFVEKLEGGENINNSLLNEMYIHSVYSKNSNGIVEIGEELNIGQIKLNEVYFTTSSGEGVVIKGIFDNKEWIENSKWEENLEDIAIGIVKADKRTHSSLKIYCDGDGNTIEIVTGHTHKLCGETGKCLDSCSIVGSAHTVKYKYVDIEKLSDITNSSQSFSLMKDIANEEIEVNREISICLSGHNMSQVKFRGNGTIYIVNCLSSGNVKEAKLNEVKFSDNLLVYIKGKEGSKIEVEKIDEYLVNTNRSVSISGVKFNVSLETNANIISKGEKVVLERTEIRGKYKESSRIVKNSTEIHTIDLELVKNVSNNSLINVGVDTNNLYVKNKLEIRENMIKRGEIVKGIVEVREGSSIYFREGYIELINNGFCYEGEGIVSSTAGIYIKKNGYLDFTGNGYIKSEESQLKYSREDEYIKDIKMVVENKTKAKETFEKNGYTMIEKNLNEGTSGKEIYIGYIKTKDSNEGITSIGQRWFNAEGRNPRNYTGKYHKYRYKAVVDFDNNQWNTNEKAGGNARWVYLYTSKDRSAGNSVITVDVLVESSSKTVSQITNNNEYETVYNSQENTVADFNMQSKGKNIYIRYKREGNNKLETKNAKMVENINYLGGKEEELTNNRVKVYTGIYSENVKAFIEGDPSSEIRCSIMFSDKSKGRGLILRDNKISEYTKSFKSTREASEGLKVFENSSKELRIGLGPDEVIDREYIINYQGGRAKGHDGREYIPEGPANYIITKDSEGGVISLLSADELPYRVNGFDLYGYSRYESGVDERGKESITKLGEDIEAFADTEEGEETKIYAIWKQKTYTIKYVAEEIVEEGVVITPKGTHKDEIGYYLEGVTISNNLNETNNEIIKATGHKIERWIDSNGREYSLGEVVSEPINRDLDTVELTAVWGIKRYDVEFVSGKSDIANVTSRNREYGYYEEVDMTNMYPPQDTVSFVGWKILRIYDKNGVELSDASEIGTRYTSSRGNQFVDIDGARIVFEAIWKNGEYEVVYKEGVARDVNGEIHEIQIPEGITIKNTVGELNEEVSLNGNIYTVEGFVFDGWSKVEEGEGEVYKAEEKIESIGTKNDEIVNVYARWREIAYDIEYEAGYATSETMEGDKGSYYSKEKLKRNTFTPKEGMIPNGWKVVKIKYKDENGVEKEEKVENSEVLTGTKGKKGKLTNRDGSTVYLEANWLSASEAHNHKICGVVGECVHIGDKHSEEILYHPVLEGDEIKDTVETAGNGEVINLYLAQETGEEDRIIEVNVGSGKTLNLCLSGNILQNIKFIGSGVINITNCKNTEGEIYINQGNSEVSFIEGLNTNIYGGGERVKISNSSDKKINYVLNVTQKSVLYNVNIGVTGKGVANLSLNSSNEWEKVVISESKVDDYIINDSRVIMKNIEISNNASQGYIIRNTDIELSGENKINKNTGRANLIDIRTMKVSGEIEVNENITPGSIIKTGSLEIENDSNVEIKSNSGKEKIVSVERIGEESVFSLGENSLISIEENELETNNNTADNSIMLIDMPGESFVMGSIDIKNNNITDNGCGLRVLREDAVLALGNSFINVKLNRSYNGKIVQVLVDNENGFLKETGGYRFDVEKSNMSVAFTNSTLGTVFVGFTNNKITEGKVATEEYKKVFMADTAYHNYNLVSVKLESQNVVITSVAGYKIVYKGGVARKNRGGTVEVGGEEYSQDIVETASGQVLLENRFLAKQFKFVGWTPIEDFAYDKNKITEYKVGSAVPDLDYARKTINGEDVVYLYGLWEETTYSIEYESGSEAAGGDTESQTVYYYDSVILNVSGFVREKYMATSWEVVGVKKENGESVVEEGIRVGATYKAKDELRELVKTDKGILVLKAVWTYVDNDGSHKHKDCGQLNGLACEHTGVKQHSNNNTEYEEWRESDSVEKAITTGAGYYYLGTDISKNNVVINVTNKLVICLNGKNLSGVRFNTSGSEKEVVIVNCQMDNAKYTNTMTESMFNGVKGRVFGKANIEVETDRIINGNSLKAINAKFIPHSDTVTSQSVVVGNSVEFSLAKVKFENYKTNQDLINLSNINVSNENIEDYITELNIQGGRYTNILRLNNSNMTVNTLRVENANITNNVLKVENETLLQLENDIVIEENENIGEGVVSLENRSITSVKRAKVSIKKNKGLKYAIKTLKDTTWSSQQESEINVVGNEFKIMNARQGGVEVAGVVEVGGQLNISENEFLGGSGEKAGLIIEESGKLIIGDANVKVIGNIGEKVHQVYSLRNDGFMESKKDNKFRVKESNMEVAFENPYTGVIYTNFTKETVDMDDSVEATERIRAESSGDRIGLTTIVTSKDGVDSLVIGKSTSNYKYNLVYEVGEGIDSDGERHRSSSETIYENDKTGEIIELKDKNTFNLAGFNLIGWRASSNNKQYEPGSNVSLTELTVEEDNSTITFTAIWSEKSYTIKYSVEESDARLIETEGIKLAYYKNQKLSATAASRENYSITNWEVVSVKDRSGNNLENNLVGKKYEKDETISGLIDVDQAVITLKAIWEEKKVLFSFNIQGATASDKENKSPSNSSVATQNVGLGDKIVFTKEGAEMKGFTLIGYRDEGKNLTFDLGREYDVNSTNFTISENNEVKLVSVWQENEYTINLLRDTGDLEISGDPVNTTVKYYEKYEIKQDTFEKPGYRIKTWNVESIKNEKNEDVAITEAEKNNYITATKYDMPATGDASITVKQLLDIPNGTINLKAGLENTHKHYRNGTFDNGTGNRSAYQPLSQVSIDNGVLVGKFGSSTGAGGGQYFLTENVQMKQSIDVNGVVSICLNGYDMDMNGYSFVRITEGTTQFQLFICSCQPARNAHEGETDKVFIRDFDENITRSVGAFEGFTSASLYATHLNGDQGKLDVTIIPFGDGSNYELGEGVTTTIKTSDAKKRGSKTGSSSSGNSSGEASNSRGEALRARSSGEANNSSNSRGEALRALAESSSGETNNRSGEAFRARSSGETNNRSGESFRALTNANQSLIENISKTKNILDMLYATNINNILTDTNLYDTGDFVEIDGKLKYIIDNKYLEEGIYKIKNNHKINIYKIDNEGFIETGIVKINNNMYYFKEMGEMAINEKIIYGNVEYEVDEMGIIKNRTIMKLGEYV